MAPPPPNDDQIYAIACITSVPPPSALGKAEEFLLHLVLKFNQISLGTAVAGLAGCSGGVVLVAGYCSQSRSLEFWETWVVQWRGQLWLIIPSIFGGG